jgi:hypothetical protein
MKTGVPAPLTALSRMSVGTPPVARCSALFCTSSRYVRGPCAPSIGGNSRTARAAVAVVNATLPTWVHRSTSGAPMAASNPCGSIAASLPVAICTAALAATTCRAALTSGARFTRPFTGASVAGSTSDLTFISAGNGPVARESMTSLTVCTAPTFAPSHGSARTADQAGPCVPARDAVAALCRDAAVAAAATRSLWTT